MAVCALFYGVGWILGRWQGQRETLNWLKPLLGSTHGERPSSP
jgi:hypothetical protein